VARRSRQRSRDLEAALNNSAGGTATAGAASAATSTAASSSPRHHGRLRSPLPSRGSGNRKSLAAALTAASSSSNQPSDASSSANAASSSAANDAALRARARSALQTNDAMVYLDGPSVYACAACRTHLTSHDDIISKSFHGRHGRAYLFDQCVNVDVGRPEDRLLITGMHSVCDIKCKRCGTMVGWTYKRAYESSQKYKEGKFIVEKINLHLEEALTGYDGIGVPAGERGDRWRKRSMSWGSAASADNHMGGGYPQSPGGRSRAGSENIVYEYRPDGGDAAGRLGVSPYRRTQSVGSSVGGGGSGRDLPPGPPNL